MKAAFFTIVGILICLNTFSQAIPDTIAIKQLMLRESTSYHKGDLKSRAACWQIQPYSRILVSLSDGRMIDVPLTSIANPPIDFHGDGGTVTFINVKISVIGNSAWVSHDQETDMLDGKKNYSTEFKILEKIEGEWKFVGMSVHIYTK